MGPGQGPQGKLEGLCVGTFNNCFRKFIPFFNGSGKKAIFIYISPATRVYSGAPARAKRSWDRAPYSWNMVNLFSFGCHVIDRAYVRTYLRTRLQIVRVG